MSNRNYFNHFYLTYTFFVKKVDIIEVFSALGAENMYKVSEDVACDFFFPMPKNNIEIEIPDSKHPIKLMVSEPIQEWTFINIDIGSNKLYKKIINQLFRFTDEAYYLHCDPHCDSLAYILCKDGEIYREFEYMMDVIDIDFGDPITEIENAFKKYILNLDKEDNPLIFIGYVIDEVTTKIIDIDYILSKCTHELKDYYIGYFDGDYLFED